MMISDASCMCVLVMGEKAPPSTATLVVSFGGGRGTLTRCW